MTKRRDDASVGSGERERQPSVADDALLSDSHSAAWVSSHGAIDWFCTPRIDSPATFSRLLDVELGGSCRIEPCGDVVETSRRYVDRSMVLETTLRTATGELRIRDCLTMCGGGRERPRRLLVRRATCTDGELDVDVLVAARFDVGLILPWVGARPPGRAGRRHVERSGARRRGVRPRSDEPLGNFLQALSHLAHIGAAVTFERGRSLLPLDGQDD